jgi:2'-5' RNA ligase
MSLLVLAFPSLDATDFGWIQQYRRINDELHYEVVDPHFTLVFPVRGAVEEEFINEIEIQSQGVGKIEFEITRAIVCNDAFQDFYHEFLVPGKGYSEIIHLHDKLYAGSLLPHMRKDIEFIPHISIGNSKDSTKCKKEIDKLNDQSLSIPGRIEKLTIADYSGDRIKTLREIDLD